MIYKDTKTFFKLKGLEKNNFPEMIICHHSGGTDANPLADTSHHTAEMMESWHLSKGWDGLGYTYVIHKDGAVWRGRPEHRSGAHTVNYNSKSIGIVLAGNFDATYPTKEQEMSFMELYKDIITRHPQLTTDNIKYHRDFAKKTCPGNNIKPDYFKNLAIQATKVETEIKDDTKEALEFCKVENSKYKSFFQKLLDLILSFK
jgi:N-acetyl-anhydromuramyl-L-alanine amidase AmpD